MEIQFISKNKDGNYYIGFKQNVARGIRGKTRGHVDELIIVGMNKSKFKEFCKHYNIKGVEHEEV